MAKASDNVFPKVRYGMQTANQAAPSDSSWTTFAKADGIYARSSNAVVGPFGSGGSGAITASGYTQATSRLLGRTTASTGAIEEISVGSGLSLAGGSLSATGGASITYADASLGADTAMASGNWVDGPSVSLTSGTWLLWGQVTSVYTTRMGLYVRLYDGTNVYGVAETQSENGNFGYYLSCACFGVAVLGGSATMKIQGRVDQSGGGMKRDIDSSLDSTHTATRIMALKVA